MGTSPAMMAASLAAEPIGLGTPLSGFTIVPAPPSPSSARKGLDSDGGGGSGGDDDFGKKTSFHTREYLGRRAKCEGGDTRWVTSWSVS